MITVLKLDNISKELNRMYEINKQLLDVLHKIGYGLVDFAKQYNYPIPSHIPKLLGKSQNLINELNNPTKIDKVCNVCNKLNPENAGFCCYCGSSLLITRMRQGNDSPDNATEPCLRFCKT